MPFVLKHRESSQIFTCNLINIYQLPYYGTKFWDTFKEAEEEAPTFLEQHQVNDSELWKVLEASEQKLKVFNVKLNNNSSNLLFIDEKSNSPYVKNKKDE
ncbi:hypothetical protein [Chengkuizengella sediminis]|uniref:hypothetical protein n=1 Tax=Chengkuizengella sediminis TaxID=1885917 RepID=UPI00138A3A8D|nr:hypothetical protein [Chengkuizengella sediminis]NDI35552.1 hypothetical protein [Chengkuizengella sediminis]